MPDRYHLNYYAKTQQRYPKSLLPAFSTTTYINIEEKADTYASHHPTSQINSLGLEKGDKVAILDNTTPEAVEMFLAVTSAGYVAINLPSQLPEKVVIGCCMKFNVNAFAYERRTYQRKIFCGMKMNID